MNIDDRLTGLTDGAHEMHDRLSGLCDRASDLAAMFEDHEDEVCEAHPLPRDPGASDHGAEDARSEARWEHAMMCDALGRLGDALSQLDKACVLLRRLEEARR